MGGVRHHPLLAGVGKNGKPWANPKIKTEISVAAYTRVLRHERVFLREVQKPNVSWSLAVKRATRAEHKGMSPRQRQVYEGRLGALERKLKRGK